jgi:hypothetical protein
MENNYIFYESLRRVGYQWLTPVSHCDPQKAESGGSQFKASLGKKFLKTLSQKYPIQKRAGGVRQGVDPEFNQYCKKIKSLRRNEK